jgi:hypothetical protein
MLHELYHTVQCVNRGGVGPFVDEYLAHGAGTIIQKGRLNVHDDIDHERDAEDRAKSLINEFGWPFVIKNDCSKKLQLFVNLKATSGDWVTKGWYVFEPNEEAQLVSGGRYVHSRNVYWYFYAEEVNGDSRWSGNQEITFKGESYMAVQKHTPNPDEHFKARLVCNTTF